MDLSEQEKQFYGELFQTCNSDGSGRISSVKAMEFFFTSGIHQDILSQVIITSLARNDLSNAFDLPIYLSYLQLSARVEHGIQRLRICPTHTDYTVHRSRCFVNCKLCALFFLN